MSAFCAVPLAEPELAAAQAWSCGGLEPAKLVRGVADTESVTHWATSNPRSTRSSR